MSSSLAPYNMANDNAIMLMFILNMVGVSYVFLMNGESIPGGGALVNVGGEPVISGALANLLKTLGLYEFVTMVIEVLMFAFSAVTVSF